MEVVKRRASRLRAETEGSSVVEKLQEELREYREILKCSICLERTKEVNISLAILHFLGCSVIILYVVMIELWFPVVRSRYTIGVNARCALLSYMND